MEIENIFVEVLLPKIKPYQTKPNECGIIYRPPNQSNSLEGIKTNFDKSDTDILGDFNINICQNNIYIIRNVA